MSSEPMSLQDYAVARRFITETRLGRRTRAAVRREEDQAKEAREALKKQER